MKPLIQDQKARIASLIKRSGKLLFAAFLCLGLPAASQASHDTGVFELDQNAVDNPLTPGGDANLIYCDHIDPDRVGMCAGIAASTHIVSTFYRDKVNDPNDDIFAGAKDSNDILGGKRDWGWKLGSANDKNDIGSVFISLERAPGVDVNNDGKDDYFLFFGLDAFSENGDAAIGFWFLQNPVTPLPNGDFSHGHVQGDILVQADITNGGRVGRYDVYTWGPNDALNQPVAPSQGELTLAIESSDCGDSAANDEACGVTNATDAVAPWPYTTKGVDGNSPTFPPITYFEGGLNLSALYDGEIPCIGAYIAETRQSQSETAELEDMVINQFDLCSLDVRKTGPELSKVGDTVSYTVEIENDGALPITKSSITDTLVNDLTDGSNPAITLFDNCGDSLDAGDTCTIEYNYVVPEMAGPLSNTVTATYLFGSDIASDTSSHEVGLFTPSVSLDKQVGDGNGGFNDGPAQILQGDAVNYRISVSNTSSANTPTLSCTVTDNTLSIDPNNTDGDGDPSTIDVMLAPGGSTNITANSGALNNPGNVVNVASVSCSPAGFVNVVNDSDTVTVRVKRRESTITVTKTGDNYTKVGDDVAYTITIANGGGSDSDLTLDSIVDNLVGDLTDGTHPAITSSDCPVAPATLNIGNSCTIQLTRETLATDSDPVTNTVTVQASDAFANTASDMDSHEVDVVAPAITVSKTCLNEPVEPGTSANFRIDITNTGDVDLLVDISDSVLGINQLDVMFGTSGSCTYDNDPSDGCLRIEAGVIAGTSPVVNQVDITATLPAVTGLANVLNDSAGDTCDVEQGGDATRTLGFWKSHGSDGDRNYPSPVQLGYTCHIARDHVGFPINLGWKTLHSCADVFGIFWSNMGKQSDGDRRTQICRTKLHSSWQLMAAILNDGLSNGATVPTDPDSGLSLIDAMVEALSGNNRKEINRLQGQLDEYNNSGDDVSIEDADGAIIPQADPNGTRDLANYEAGDC
ncbi:hypothetical protein Y5S_02625 [Alcanivorax nanhaiticus]|uniref:Uncharacterized protein n=1 Tax=Alcanivorax nanhaiticus TaxID=1177154 RepID=A0A095UNN9_9GAMM|nr:DUF11 domain-containing protein [Alcanivorax nanhaiticus]KGD64085.1 hypothetical protein Y5S_02625 [Alcanivorax nanhaiticus]